ncbi:hypothetical protein ACP4OV_023853 [Aristida adscensionis]
MESVDGNGGSRQVVVTQLSHIQELVGQLELHLGVSPDLCKNLLSQIFFAAERSIGIITSSALDSPLAAAASPLSDAAADEPFKATKNKKRKMAGKLRHQVRVSSAGGGDNPGDDGHSWRKYGQKEILGAKHPRGYYRCTHRRTQGCQATKQVQRADDDPTLFDVIYHGEHTCVHKALAAAAAAEAQQPPEQKPDAHGNKMARTAGHAVATEPQGRSAATAFFFSSTPASACLAPEHGRFSAPESPENWGVSPASSGSNHDGSFAAFAAAAGNAGWRAQAEVQEVVSALVAASAPEPAVDMDFVHELLNLDQSIDDLDQSIASYLADPYAAEE